MAYQEAEDEFGLADAELDEFETELGAPRESALRCPYCHARLTLSARDAQDRIQIPCSNCRSTSLILIDPLGMPRCWVVAD